MKSSFVTANLALALTLAAACAPTSHPPARVVESEAEIRRALDLGADRAPDAAVHLELAEHQLAQARRYIDDGDREKAGWMLMRAEADARLAQALAQEARARQVADQMAARVRDLASGTHASAGDPP